MPYDRNLKIQKSFDIFTFFLKKRKKRKQKNKKKRKEKVGIGSKNVVSFFSNPMAAAAENLRGPDPVVHTDHPVITFK